MTFSAYGVMVSSDKEFYRFLGEDCGNVNMELMYTRFMLSMHEHITSSRPGTRIHA